MTLRSFSSVFFVLFLTLFLVPAAAQTTDNKRLIVYVYDSFAAEWGPGNAIAAAFKKATGIDVSYVVLGDAGQALARLIAEKKVPVADVVVGIDNNLARRAFSEGVLQPYKPVRAAIIPPDLTLDPEWRLTPFDWGCFAIVWDSKTLAVPPANLDALADPAYARKLVIMDPRTSSPGLGFLAWTVAVYGNGSPDYWQRLRPSVLTMTPGWDSGYGLFVAGEAPLVVSYTTSPAYHVQNDGTDRYKALLFPEGHPVQIEGAGIVTGTKRLAAARAFIDFIISPEVQALLPTTQWMFPIDQGIALPESFKAAPKPKKLLRPDPSAVATAVDAAINALLHP